MLRHTCFRLESIRIVRGFALTLIGIWPAIAHGQSLSFFKALSAGPPPWSAAAAAGDATGIYAAESDTFLRKCDRDVVEIWSRKLGGLQIRSIATAGAGVFVGGLGQNGSVESVVRLYDVQGDRK